jgi:hypothetical protein
MRASMRRAVSSSGGSAVTVFAGWFALVVGVGIIGLWTVLLATRQVPEVAEGDPAIWFHLAAEYLLGITLVVSGSLILAVGYEPVPNLLVAAALGGTVYSAINSAGYYARTRTWGTVGAFALVIALATATLVVTISTCA